MNRAQRRRAERLARRGRRVAPACLLHPHAGELRPQACVLWIRGMGYVAEASPETLRTFDGLAFARVMTEEEAEAAVLDIRQRTGLPVAVRPFHLHHSA